MFKLYRNPSSCDSDDWGPPDGEFGTLAEAMSAADLPEPSGWRVMSRDCPDEVFTPVTVLGPAWSILSPGAAREAAALGVTDLEAA